MEEAKIKARQVLTNLYENFRDAGKAEFTDLAKQYDTMLDGAIEVYEATFNEYVYRGTGFGLHYEAKVGYEEV